MIVFVAFIAIFGILGMTWLFPILALGLDRLSRTNQTNGLVPVRSLAVLIPAHNEEQTLPGTVASIRVAIEELEERFPTLPVQILVGADGCTDKTGDVALKNGANVLRTARRVGKWKMMKTLVEACPEAEWVAFADAGILWLRDFLLQALPHCCNPGVVAVSPTYRNSEQGSVERMLWTIERHFKSLEARAGGPVSLHGSTVLYRRRELLEVLHQLEEDDWLNDDVIIPVMLRASFPDKVIRYVPTLEILDRPRHAPRTPAPEFTRRTRMVAGNTQWIKSVFPSLWEHNVIAGVIALRRIFRLFWAYWGIAAFGVLTLVFISLVSPAVAGTVFAFGALAVLLGIRFNGSIRMLCEAALASLLAPYYMLKAKPSAAVGWR